MTARFADASILLLGERITNAAVEGTGDADAIAGLGLLPVEIRRTGSPRPSVRQTPRDGIAVPVRRRETPRATPYRPTIRRRETSS
ncbi:hypothetical protein BRD08_08515 [Halobacteriales archaeon SW_10_66_29]|nr:MAG: hypothetical protein BRC73_03265 [Halobacteriales archaeon QH_7_66_37]PSQ34838.1 MAG: hypothetical protein BRD08_08515 [Halobacteriales archaeon SW_10_66_29]